MPNTFIATAAAVTYCGAKPVFVDVEEKTYNMDSSLLEAAITPKTKAIIPVHLFGQAVDMDPLMEIAEKRGLWVWYRAVPARLDALRNVQFVMKNGVVFKKDGVMTPERFFHPGPVRTPNGRWTR